MPLFSADLEYVNIVPFERARSWLFIFVIYLLIECATPQAREHTLPYAEERKKPLHLRYTI